MAEALPMQKYVVEDVMRLCINEKVRTIELCLGDITGLDSQRNKVDVLLISALPDSYNNEPGTVLHALHKNLKLSVAELAKNKEMDYRDRHKCWFSKPLQQIQTTATLPYGRVMCYESGANNKTDASEFIFKAFRCLMEIFKSQECTVASSLLNTGRQKLDEVVMLGAIVEAAIAAMTNGLNLTQLMVFIHAKFKSNAVSKPINVRNFSGICEKFKALKSRHEPNSQFL